MPSIARPSSTASFASVLSACFEPTTSITEPIISPELEYTGVPTTIPISVDGRAISSP